MPSGKKIIRLFSRLNIGGPAIHVVNLCTGLQNFGYETTLVVGESNESEGSMDDFAVEKGVKLHAIRSFQAAPSPIKDLRAFFSITRLLWREKPDFVHTHTFKAGLLGRLAAILTGAPIVVHTYHGHLLNGYWGRIGTAVIRVVERFLARFTTQIITVSQQVADDLVAVGIVPREKIRVIELGFDVDGIQDLLLKPPTLRRDLGIAVSAQVVGIVGRLVPVKSVDLFLRSLVPLLDTNPDLHLVIVGDGTEGPSLKKQAAQLTSCERLHFTGWRRPVVTDLPDLDLCICSSKNEGTSVSIIEAVMAGVPVISTQVGGMSDLLGHNRWGELVPYAEAPLREAVARKLKILKMASSDPDRQNLAAQSREAADVFKHRFSMRRLLEETNSVYDKLSPGDLQ